MKEGDLKKRTKKYALSIINVSSSIIKVRRVK